MAYASLGQVPFLKRGAKRLPSRPPGLPAAVAPDGHVDLRRKLPAGVYQKVRSLYQPTVPGGPSSPDLPVDWRAVALRMRGQAMPLVAKRILAKAERGGTLSAYEEEYLQGFFKKIFKPIAKIVKPVVTAVKAVVKPVLTFAKQNLPLVATAFLGPGAGATVASLQAAMKQSKVKEQATAEVQQAPGWGSLTLAEQAAILNSMTAGAPPPNIAVPADVAAAYQRAIQSAVQSVPTTVNVPGTPTFAPAPAPGLPQMPMPWEAAPVPTEAAVTGGIIPGLGPMGSLAVIGAGVLAVTMVLGGGRRRR